MFFKSSYLYHHEAPTYFFTVQNVILDEYEWALRCRMNRDEYITLLLVVSKADRSSERVGSIIKIEMTNGEY